jgi:hypothetical protein
MLEILYPRRYVVGLETPTTESWQVSWSRFRFTTTYWACKKILEQDLKNKDLN